MMAYLMNSFSETKKIILADLFRYEGRADFYTFIKHLIRTPGFRYSLLFRITRFLKNGGPKILPIYLLFRYILYRNQIRFGISIPYNTEIGKGLYIGHFGSIVLNAKCTIGINCNLNHGVTIGEAYGGKYPGVPTIGNNVYIGPGSTIIGGVLIGDDVAIGAGAVVARSFPDFSVVGGVPASIISNNGSKYYVTNRC